MGLDLQDISTDPGFADMLGYTQEELETSFTPYLKVAAERLAISYYDLLLRLQQHYQGFCFDYEASTKLYINQFCAQLRATDAAKPQFEAFWLKSNMGTPALNAYLQSQGLTWGEDIAQSQQTITLKTEPFSLLKQADLNLPQLLLQSGVISIQQVNAQSVSLPPSSRSFECCLTNLEVKQTLSALCK